MTRNPVVLFLVAQVVAACSAAGSGRVAANIEASADAGADLDRSIDTGLSPPTADLFVDPVHGNDAWAGTLPSPSGGNGPLATVGSAQSRLRSLLGSKTSGRYVVMLRSGTYYNPMGLAFGKADSGTSTVPVLWQAYPGETPVINGGFRVTAWSKIGALWKATLPANIPGTQTPVSPFENVFYNGKRLLRPRTGVDAQDPLGTFLHVASEVYSATPSATCPAAAFVTSKGYKCFDRFAFTAGDLSSSWKNLYPAAGNPCGAAPGPDPSLVGDVEIDLFEDWTMEKMRVQCIDSSNNIVYFTASTPQASSVSDIDFWGPVIGHRYMVENVADLLAPGQWFLDRSTTPLTLEYMPVGSENPANDTVIVPQAQPLISLTQTSYVTFQGTTFEMDNYVPSPSGYNRDDNGEDNLPGGIDCESCQNATFEDVSVRSMSATGIFIATQAGSLVPSQNVVVQDSAVYDVGGSGIHVGRAPMSSSTDASAAQFVTLRDNVVQGFSRAFADGQGIDSGVTHDLTIDHNDITDGYHGGIAICIGGCTWGAANSHGNFNIVSTYNHIWQVLQGLTSDGGALYYNLGDTKQTATGGKILNNLVHDVTDDSIIDKTVGEGGIIPNGSSAYGGDGIYLDDQTGGVDVENNVVYRVSGFGLQQSKGQAPNQPTNTVSNNIFAYARHAMYNESRPWPQGCPSVAPTSTPLRISLTNNIFYFDRSGANNGFSVQSGCAYSCGLPYDQYQSFAGNLFWDTKGNFATLAAGFHTTQLPPSDPTTCAGANAGPDWAFGAFTDWQGSVPLSNGTSAPMNEDGMGTASVNPAFHSPGPAYPNDVYVLDSDPIDGFQSSKTNDTVAHAGRTNKSLVPPPVPETFPTYSYNPATDY